MFWKLTSIPYEHASYTGLISGGKIISWWRRQGKLNIYNLIISIYYIYNISSLKKKMNLVEGRMSDPSTPEDSKLARFASTVRLSTQWLTEQSLVSETMN